MRWAGEPPGKMALESRRLRGQGKGRAKAPNLESGECTAPGVTQDSVCMERGREGEGETRLAYVRGCERGHAWALRRGVTLRLGF